MLTVFRALSIVLLLSCIAVYISTFTTQSVSSYGSIWPLQVAVMFLLFSTMFTIFRRQSKLWKANCDLNFDERQRLLSNAIVPWSARIVGAIGLIIIVPATLTTIPDHGGHPELRGERYVLASHGREVAEITESEYIRANIEGVRASSGIWTTFSWLAFVFYWLVPKTTYPPQPGPSLTASAMTRS
jgi:hypothetical protein